MKRYRLKREWCFVLGFIVALVVVALTEHALNNYDEYLQACDVQKGYTCNIFGQ